MTQIEHRVVPVELNLALQGGGSHGAFTWGALERLLEQREIAIRDITGTSSGAMNATCLALGLALGGRDRAIELLEQFWTEVAREVPEGFQHQHPFAAWLGDSGIDAFPGLKAYVDLTHVLSPYQINPLGLNPLRDILGRLIDFERLRAPDAARLYISATNVRTGKIKVFSNRDLSVDVLLASACLPSLHHAVEIDGESYWDGGFSGNPPLFPLVFESTAADILVIMLQPLTRPETPTTADEIRQRQAELSFNTAFLREMRAIAMCKDRIEKSWFPVGALERCLHRLKLHVICADEIVSQLEAGSHFNTLPAFLSRLREAGRARADEWWHGAAQKLGRASTVDLVALFC